MMRAGGQDPEVDALFEEGRRAGADFLLDLLGVEKAHVSPPLRAAELENLALAAVVAALSTVRNVDCSVTETLRRLRAAL